MARPLVLAAHGTADPAGQAVIHDLAAAAQARLGVPVHPGFVDVCAPTLTQALAGLVAPVVVPAFLTSGYHVGHDVPLAAARVPDALVTPAFGAAPEVVEALAARLREASGGRVEAPVAMVAAGSTDPAARGEVDLAAARLGALVGRPAVAGFLTGPGPTAHEAIHAAIALAAGTGEPGDAVVPSASRSEPGGRSTRVLVAAYLLAPGHFARRLERLCTDLGLTAAAPLGAHPRLVDLVVRRYLNAGDPRD